MWLSHSITRKTLFAVPFAASLALAGGADPDVGLHNVTIVPDSATYAAIASSAFLRDTFALVDESPSQGDAEDALALFGRSTYIEFRRPGAPRADHWSSRVALGSDRHGTLDLLAERLTSEVGPVRRDSLVLTRGPEPIPWLYRLSASRFDTDSTLALHVVEYHPQFLARWAGASARPGTVRADVLSVYARRAGADQPRRPAFLDIVGVKVAAADSNHPHVLGHCRAVGWRVMDNASGAACVASDVRLYVVPPENGAHGVVAFTMRVAASSRVRRGSTYTFGSSTLRISRNGFATWEFPQPR
jgi:hypothetical protein